MKLSSPVLDPVVTSPYGWRFIFGSWQFHNGIDYVSKGDQGADGWQGSREVFAIAEGTVIFDYDAWKAGDTSAEGSGGNMVIVQHVIDGKLYFARYLHLSSNYVHLNQKVRAGEALGNFKEVAGLATGRHLHFDLYDAAWSNIDPQPILRAAGITVDPA